jgi:hypothetical protein
MASTADRDPRHHIQKMQRCLKETMGHLREDIEKVDEPQLNEANFRDWTADRLARQAAFKGRARGQARQGKLPGRHPPWPQEPA